MTQARRLRIGIGWLGFASLAALTTACGSSGGPLPGANMNQGGSSAGSTANTSGSGGMQVAPQAGSGSGGAATSGASNGGSAGTATGTSGSGGSGSGSGNGDMITEPEGKIPNEGMPPDMIDLPESSWPEGLVSPTLEEGHHQNQPIVLHGYVQGAGNAEIVFYDIADPTDPQLISRLVSPDFDPTAGPKGVGEAESHQTSLARYGNKFYQVITGGRGVDIFDVSDPHQLRHVTMVELPGVNYGDFTEAVWGMYWQGDTIYVGGTNTGLHILDAKDPENITRVKTIGTGSAGGISTGPLWAVGNTLVVTTPKESGGIATLDISDPHNPMPQSSIKPSASYIGGFYGRYAWLQSPLRAWDVLTDPYDIGTANSPAHTLPDSAFTDYPAASEYTSFADGYMYLGHLRPNAGVSKINIKNLSDIKIESRIWGRLEFTNGDDQFSIQVGSMLVLADDELPYRGMVIAAHSTTGDSVPPAVDTVLPRDGETGLKTSSRIGLSFTDNLELATVHPGSVIVRPMGGQPIEGSFGLYMTVLNFDPKEDLLPNTTYEVVVPQGGVKDLVGNGIAAEFKSTFTTGP
ncbi:MAG TPA: Ig-like domain-containing protein [Polyangiaceae bacterium]|nr:Ig-like domain-containing protein [Polyangiaceae bacterium]